MGILEDKPLSPNAEISFKRFEGNTTLRERVVAVGAARVVLLQNDPNRVAWHIINEGTIDVRVSTDPTITATSGWLLMANGGLIDVIYYDDGESTGYQVFAISSGAGSNVRVREIVRL